MSIKEHPPLHVPVLLESVLHHLNPQSGESYLDLTAGYGGHATAILARTKNYSESVLVDRDEFAIQNLSQLASLGVDVRRGTFVEEANNLLFENRTFDLILVDLGVSSPQLDMSNRGFSFTNDGPLDMRMDNRQELTAEQVVNTYSEEQLEAIFMAYGEESLHTARRYARAIVGARPIMSTGELADIIRANYVGKWSRVHPATRTFQAIRIEVNEELSQIRGLLPSLPRLMNLGARVGIISFHSLEDRIVKKYFLDQARAGYESELQILNKKPILGSMEDVNNPRARSAKLRVARKTK